MFLTTLGGRVLTVGVWLLKDSGGSCPGWAGKIFGPRLSGPGEAEAAP